MSKKSTARSKANYRNHNPRGKAGAKNDIAIVLHRQALVAEYYRKGYTHYQTKDLILKEHGIEVSQPTISNDIRAMLAMWQEECLMKTDQARAAQLMSIRAIKRNAYEEFEFSKQKHVKIQPKKGDKDQTVKVIIERQEGNPAWLNIVKQCEELEAKITGTLINVSVNNINNGVVNNIDGGFWDALKTPPREVDVVEAEILKITEGVPKEA